MISLNNSMEDTISNIKKKSTLNWYVIYTKPRNEKKVIERLLEIGIDAYCPLRITKEDYSDRKKSVAKPLFNSYCFVRLEEKNLRDVFKIIGVVRYIYWCGKPAIIRDNEIEEIRRWLSEYEHDAIKVQTLKPNDLIKIQNGPFKEKTGRVVSKKGNKLILLLAGLGLRIVVKIGETELEKVENDKVLN